MSDQLNNMQLNKKKLFLFALVGAIIIYLDLSMVMKSQLGAIKSRNSKIKELKVNFDSFERDMKKMQEAKSKEQSGLKDLKKGKRTLSHDSLVALLQGISGLANKNNVKLLKATPSEEKPLVPNAPAPAASIMFAPVIIRLELVSDYHSLGSFINEVESDQILVLVQELSITSEKQDPMKQRINLVLKTYVKK